MIRGITKSKVKAALGLTLMAGLFSAPAQALLQNEITVGGFRVDSSNAADGFIVQSPNYRFLDNSVVRTLSSVNGVLQYEGNSLLLSNTPLQNVTIDVSNPNNNITNIRLTNFATSPALAGQVLAYDANGVLSVIPSGTAGQILTSAGAGQRPVFANNAGSVGGGTVTMITSSDGSVTITNPTTIPDLAIAAAQPNVTSIGTAAQATMTGALAFGNNATANNMNSVAIGPAAMTTADNQIVLGSNGLNGNPPAPTVVINGPLNVAGGIITPPGQNLTVGGNGTGLTFVDNTSTNNITITNNNGVLQAVGQNGSVTLNNAVLNEVQVVLNPTTTTQTITLGANANAVEFINITPNTLFVNLATNQIEIGTQNIPLVANTPIDISRLNLRLTYNNVANTLQVDLINSLGFNSIKRELIAQVTGPLK